VRELKLSIARKKIAFARQEKFDCGKPSSCIVLKRDIKACAFGDITRGVEQAAGGADRRGFPRRVSIRGVKRKSRRFLMSLDIARGDLDVSPQ
jgi:hypothetical protein